MTVRQVLLYSADAFFLAALSTILLKIHIEKISSGISAKTQGLYVAIFVTRYLHIIFDEENDILEIVNLSIKLIFILTSVFLAYKIRRHPEKEGCTCNEDSFWVEALVIPVIIFTAVVHVGHSPEWILWSFSMYLEVGAMLPQLYLIHERGKGDSFVGPYINFMACYSLCSAIAFSSSYFGLDIDDSDPELDKEYRDITWTICKIVQLLIYSWYFFIPKKPVLPAMTCEERRRRPTLFQRQESMLAQSLLNKKNNSTNDLSVYVIGNKQNSPTSPPVTTSKTPKSIRKVPGTPVSLRSIRFFDPLSLLEEGSQGPSTPPSPDPSIQSTESSSSSEGPLDFCVVPIKY